MWIKKLWNKKIIEMKLIISQQSKQRNPLLKKKKKQIKINAIFNALIIGMNHSSLFKINHAVMKINKILGRILIKVQNLYTIA